MSIDVATLRAKLVADTGQFTTAMAGANNVAAGSAGKMKSKFALIAKVGAAAGGVLAAKFGVDAVKAFGEAEKVAAQTTAVLKSTGGAAKVSASEVSELASALSKKSGLDDEAIQSGENLLLTFTKIRNETGKGNDIFNQATSVITDMSVALGQDMKSSAIQVGKALNDPIKGVTALQRVGVSFTKGQKEQIKTLAESGKVMAAQKLILKELNMEFGGSAKAAGDTFPGQIAKLKVAFENMKETLGKFIVSGLMSLFAWVKRNEATFREIGATIKGAVVSAFERASSAVSTLRAAFSNFVAALRSGDTMTVAVTASLAGLVAGFVAFKVITSVIAAVTALKAALVAMRATMIALNAAVLANPFVLAAAAIVALGVAIVVAYKHSEQFRDIVNRAFASVKTTVVGAMNAVRGALASANAAVSAWVSKNRTEINAVGQAFQNIGRIAATVFRTTIGVALAAGATAIRAFGAVFRNVLAPAFEFALSAARRAMPGIESVVRGGLQVLQGIVKVFAGIFTLNFGRAFDGLGDIVRGAFRVIPGAIRAFTAPVREAVARIASAALGALKALPGALYSVGTQMIQGMINGVASMAGALVAKVKSVVTAPINVAKGILKIKSPSQVFFDIGANVGLGLANGVASMRAKVAQSARENLIFPLEDTIGELERKKEQLAKTWESSDLFGRMSGLRKTAGGKDVKGKEDDQRRKTARAELRDLQRDLIRTKALAKIDVEIRGLEQARGMRDALRQIGDQLRGKIADAVDKYRQNWQRTAGAAFDAQTDLILANTDAAKELQALRLEQTAESRAEETKRAQDRIAAAMLSGDTVELLEAQKEAANVARSQRMTDLEAFVAAESTKISEERAAARQAMEDAAAAAFEDSLQAQLASELESLEARKQAYATFVRDVQAILGPLGFGFEADAGHEAALASPLPKKKTAVKKPAPKKPRAKRRARGGLINRGEWSWVGEQGPELVRLPSGSRMFSSQDSAGMGGGTTNLFNVTVNALDPQTAATAVVRAIDEFERRNGARYQRA